MKRKLKNLEEMAYNGQVILKIIHVLRGDAKILPLIMRENSRIQQMGPDTRHVDRVSVQDPRLNLEKLA